MRETEFPNRTRYLKQSIPLIHGYSLMHRLKENRAMIALLRKAGGKPRYTEYMGVGDAIWERVFQEPGLTDWLFSQHQ